MSDLIPEPKGGAVIREDRMGRAHVLCVGISKQDPKSRFHDLPQCENDALEVRNTFADYPQLFAKESDVKVMTTKGGSVSRGAILSAVADLATRAGDRDRIIFFYSGHGHRLADDQLYLVPEDAYNSDDPGCLVPFSEVVRLMNNSRARQKIAILDACWSGPKIAPDKGFLPGQMSQKFLNDYIAKTKGVAVLTSCTESQTSTSVSPDPKLSLFTYYLLLALRGDPRALDEFILTLPKLFEFLSVAVVRESRSRHKEQEPVLDHTVTGTIVLGDFTPRVVTGPLALNKSAVSSVAFSDWEKLQVKKVFPFVTKLRGEKYIEGVLNSKLAEYYEGDLGSVVATLINSFDFADGSVTINEASVTFPGGSYSLTYEATAERDGQLVKTVSVFGKWLTDASELMRLIECLDLGPSDMTLSITGKIEQSHILPGLKAEGWKATNLLPNRAELSKNGLSIVVERSSITLNGFLVEELFGEIDTAQSRLANQILQLVAPTPAPILAAEPPKQLTERTESQTTPSVVEPASDNNTTNP